MPHFDLQNHQPFSGLCFIPKLVKRVVASLLNNWINSNLHQSPYQPILGRSTEAALLTIKSDIHLSLAHGEHPILVVLDLSAAFEYWSHQHYCLVLVCVALP